MNLTHEQREYERSREEERRERVRKFINEAIMMLKYGVKQRIDARYYKGTIRHGLDDLRMMIESNEDYATRVGSGKVLWFYGEGYARASVDELLAWQELNEMIKEHIRYLVSNGKAISVKDIANDLGVTPQKVSKVIWMMKRETKQEGWYWRRKSYHNRSVYVVHVPKAKTKAKTKQ